MLSGADEDGMLALCRMFAVSDYEGALPTVTVRYFGGSESGASSDCFLMLTPNFLCLIRNSLKKSPR